MINSAYAYSLEKAGDWDALFELVSSWPSVQAKHWYLGNYYLLYKCDYLSAVEVYGRLLSTACQLPVHAYLRFGKALHGCDRVEEALQCYLKVLVSRQIFDNNWRRDALIAYGLACLELGLYEHLLLALSKFNEKNIFDPLSCYLAAQARFFLGDWSMGWHLYESRKYWFNCPLSNRQFQIWQLGDSRPHGDSIFLSSDLGIGDFIFFLRFVPRLRQYYRSISVITPSNLCLLAKKSCFFDQVISVQDLSPGDAKFVLNLSSICSFLGSDSCAPEASSPSPYLSILDPLSPDFESFLSFGRKKPLVALNWCGNQEAESPSLTVRARSVPIEVLEAISALNEVEIVSVQLGRNDELIRSSLNKNIHPFQDQFDRLNDDLSVTASMLMRCDLLITNDTSLAHLGGAMGLPTWVMLKCYPCWQWGCCGDSAWYKSVQCFRQHRPFDWASVAVDVNKALEAFIASAKFS